MTFGGQWGSEQLATFHYLYYSTISTSHCTAFNCKVLLIPNVTKKALQTRYIQHFLYVPHVVISKTNNLNDRIQKWSLGFCGRSLKCQYEEKVNPCCFPWKDSHQSWPTKSSVDPASTFNCIVGRTQWRAVTQWDQMWTLTSWPAGHRHTGNEGQWGGWVDWLHAYMACQCLFFSRCCQSSDGFYVLNSEQKSNYKMQGFIGKLKLKQTQGEFRGDWLLTCRIYKWSSGPVWGHCSSGSQMCGLEAESNYTYLCSLSFGIQTGNPTVINTHWVKNWPTFGFI